MDEVVVGMEDLQSRFDELESLVTKRQVLARAMRKGGMLIVERAKELAPDDPDTADSRMKDNVRIIVTDQTSYSVRGIITVKPWNFIARFAEYGTAFESARAWLRPAFDQTVKEAIRTMQSVLSDQIKKAFKKQALDTD